MGIENFEKYLESYQGISGMLKQYGFEEIASHVATVCRVDMRELLRFPMGGYSKGQTSGAYLFVLKDMIENISRYDQVYEMLCDEESKEVFTNLIKFRILPDPQFIKMAADTKHPQYFDKTIVRPDAKEVFVDCGGFTGDTVEAYIQNYGQYEKIYVYEPSDDNIDACRRNLKEFSNIILRNCGVGEKNTVLPILNNESASSFAAVNSSGNQLVQIVCLDEDIKEPITYLKMDIEGFEIPALIGAKNHIKNDSPKLAVCTYHVISDMWEIPLLIRSINPNYMYYMRHYLPDHNWETVLYAIPKVEKVQYKKPVKVVAFPDKEAWYNVELTKDCGLIPYLLYKNFGLDVTMVGADKDTYTSLDTYVKGLNMEYLPSGSEEEKIEYLRKYGKEIDCLLLRGGYLHNGIFAETYKQINAEGKIYVGLDANSHWMDRISWDDPAYIRFMESCDVIATSCKALQEHLNEKWPWKIEYLPNGYYGFNTVPKEPVFDNKQNTILTVARIGTKQKANHVMLEAFALIANKIPEWKLKLVGNMEEEFKSYLTEYFDKYPQLVSRVEFTGPIYNKEVLFKEYLSAKIFTLTSVFEGGCPNVLGEALTAGCAIGVTKFDAWEEAIDSGRCGVAAEIDDVFSVAKMYLYLCTTANLQQMSKNAYEYARRNYDMEKIVSKLYEMLFGGI